LNKALGIQKYGEFAQVLIVVVVIIIGEGIVASVRRGLHGTCEII
jgi:hypothetical protein